MPLVESAEPGLSPGPLPYSASAGSKKEKKKQAKEERDRLKQAEKKKRRLEKALATAAAIRSELEKKKQRRKDEERLLDEEGAALAEAVALQVLVDEESDGLGQIWVASEGDSQNGRDGEGGSSLLERIGDETETREPLQHNRVQHHSTFMCSPSSEGNERETKGLNWSEWDAHAEGQQVGVRDNTVVDGELLQGEGDSTWECCNCNQETVRASNERAHATEAAAQAVAALQIAEEAQAKAEATQKAAKAAMNDVLDHVPQKRPEYIDETTVNAQCVEKERDELKGQLQETERKLHEQTCRVVELEQNLEKVTRYLLEFKAMIEDSKYCTQAMCHTTREEKTGSEEGNADPTHSAGSIIEESLEHMHQ